MSIPTVTHTRFHGTAHRSGGPRAGTGGAGGTAAEFGAEPARRLGRWVPHDGFQMIILDPLSRAGRLYAQRDCYSNQASHALKIPRT